MNNKYDLFFYHINNIDIVVINFKVVMNILLIILLYRLLILFIHQYKKNVIENDQ